MEFCAIKLRGSAPIMNVKAQLRNNSWAMFILKGISLFPLIGSSLLAAPVKEILGNDGATMLLVSAGPFIMGSADGKPDERPPHQVDLPAYYIDRFEVT